MDLHMFLGIFLGFGCGFCAVRAAFTQEHKYIIGALIFWGLALINYAIV